MASQRNGTIYTGKTNNLIKRVSEHKTKYDPKCFTAKYDVNMLVYYEHYPDHWSAATREKSIKNRKRKWKLNLIECDNPQWKDLFEDITK